MHNDPPLCNLATISQSVFQALQPVKLSAWYSLSEHFGMLKPFFWPSQGRKKKLNIMTLSFSPREKRERVVAKVEESLPLSTHLFLSLHPSLSLSTKQKQTSILEVLLYPTLIQADLNNHQTKENSDWLENVGYETLSVWNY